MKAILRGYGVGVTVAQKQISKATASDATRTRGTAQKPNPPQDIQVQSGPRGLFVTWGLPSGFNMDIQRWRVYKDNEDTLYAEVNDRGTRQCFIEATAGTTPPVVNVFVSSLNSLGVESHKIQAQGKSATETGAPAMPNVPPGYTSGSGANLAANYLQNSRFPGGFPF